ncbi:helicase loader DnaI [Agrilactobacillus composti DSM 18527 = JCM 14202]|nr:primosomal protein DnaI [Agrilactobacillus composti]GAF39642.1 helicase loader DnaI [Agrilactobacillus composti DSM 18527 = JCM 14202]
MKNLQSQLAAYMDKRQLSEKYQKVMHDAVRNPNVLDFVNKHKEALKPDAIEKSASKIYEFVREKKKADNGEVGLVPGYVPELLVSNGLIDVSYVPSKALISQEKQRNLAKRVQRINISKDITNASIENYYVNPDRQAAIDAAKEFILNFKTAPKTFHQGLYLYGPMGVGKTYLIGAIANALAHEGYSSLMLHFPTLSVEMKSAIGDNSVLSKIESIKRAQILMLDDIGADMASAWIRDDVLGVILQYRMQEQLATFFTSNFSMDQLEDILAGSVKGIEPIKASRIMERIAI